jgi:hypothetical protein
MRVFASVLVFGLVLAGCAGPSQQTTTTTGPPRVDHGPGFEYDAVDSKGLPVPVLLCHEAQRSEFGEGCNFNMTPTPTRQGNEVTIAVNPTNPRNIVGGAKDYFPGDAGECVWDGVYVTEDGGRTAFQDRSFDGSPWRLLQDPGAFKPNYASQFWCTTDPVAYFDVNGRFYYLLMAYQADRLTGSKFCDEICPQGALNDWAFNRATQIVAVSDDGGKSFHTFTPVLEGSYPVNFHDKGWIAAGADGTIHVMWLAFFVPGNQYCRSTDQGRTFLCTHIAGIQFLEAGQGSFIDVGTGLEVYLAWESNGIRIKRSLDAGETWGPIHLAQDVNDATMPGLSPRDRRGGFPAMATDRNAASPYADSIYFVWQDSCMEETWKKGCSGKGSSIWFIASQDRGETFSAPVRVSSGSEGWRIFPAVSVSPGGVIDVSWMDTAGMRKASLDGKEHDTFGQMHTYSLDGGKTWSRPFAVRDAGDNGWDPALCHHQNGMIFIGDYNDIDSSWQAAHPVWPDSRDGKECKVYTATIQRPMFAEGWDPELRAQAEAYILEHPL